MARNTSRASIVNGVWTRNVPWKNRGVWRTDIFKTVLSDRRLQQCRFVLKGGPTVLVPAEELRRVLGGGAEHYDGKIWGPFDIDPAAHTIDRQRVQMQIV